MQNINVNIVPDSYPQTIRYSQGDVGREFKINVVGFTIPTGATVKIQATKPSGFGFSVAGTVVGNAVSFTTTAIMTDEAGRFPAELEITKDSVVIGTANFIMWGEANPHPEGTTDGQQGTIIPELTLLVERVEAAASSVLDMQVVAETLAAGSQASYSYDEDTNTATFGIPQGEAGAGAAGVVASAYSSSKTYKVGDYVLHNSNLYRCTTAITTAEAFTAAHWTQIVLADDVSDLKTDLGSVKEKLVLYKSDNLSQSDSDWTSGYYMGMNGTAYASSGVAYSAKIPVTEGDVVRCYANRGGTFGILSLRFICAYDSSGVAQSDKGSNADVNTYTVPEGITHIIITIRDASNYNYVVLLNKTTTEYIPYFAPYYVAEYDFIEEALKEYNVPNVTPKGYNLLPNATKADGVYYYASGSNVASGSSATYTSFIVNAKKNTDYVFASNSGARWWIVTDDDNVVVKSGTFLTGYSATINTGNGTKIWLSCYTSDYNIGVLSLNEGYCGSMEGLQKPSFLNGISLLLQGNKYACSLPRDEIRMTQGIDETFYFENMVSLDPKLLNMSTMIGGSPYSKWVDGGVEVEASAVTSSVNGYRVAIYDQGMSLIDSIAIKPFTIKAKNLQNCSALVIGDSQIKQGVITSNMLASFTEASKALTLLGTRGTAPNLNEGRSGWGANTYCTQASSGGVTNAFWNPSTSKFDFAYYMNQQGYSSVDFVIINLSGNDLYNAEIADSDQLIANTVGYIFEMIDSILAFNSSQKIILNLAPATTNKMADAINLPWKVKNVYTRYNNIMQVLLRDSAYLNKVRTSYTHLVVDPSTDLADHIHENADGYKKMADELINQINCWQN